MRILITAALLSAAPAAAHHGWSGYDETKLVSVTGPVATSRWANPHGEITLKTRGKEWQIILAPVTRMSARGLAEGEIAPGKAVRVEGYINNSNPNELRAERIIIGRKTVELR